MSKQPLRLIIYLLISLASGIMVTLAVDSFENIAVEKRIRKELEQEIRVAAASFKNSTGTSRPEQVVKFIREFSTLALSSKIIAVDPLHDKKPDRGKFAFLFSFETGDERLDFYILTSYLNNELAILDNPELVFGLFMTIVVFTCIILYTDKKKQAMVLHQQFEEKHAEFRKVLEEHEALALLGRMVATLAHELKTPIATISNLVQVLPARIGDERFTNRFVSLTTEELNRIRQLINNLLAYGKELEVGSEEWIDLFPFMDEIAQKSSLQLEVPQSVDIYGDRFLLYLLFDNLMRNSKNEGANKVQLKLRTEKPLDSFTDFLLEDDGKGFPANIELDTLLNPFITCHSSGAGLGLYLVRKIATAHYGDVTLYRIENGAGVNISLPTKRVVIHERK
jgi:signal transduction histidine kinase